jgi:hypothetical protein
VQVIRLVATGRTLVQALLHRTTHPQAVTRLGCSPDAELPAGS